jgi:hypothetical protein
LNYVLKKRDDKTKITRKKVDSEVLPMKNNLGVPDGKNLNKAVYKEDLENKKDVGSALKNKNFRI